MKALILAGGTGTRLWPLSRFSRPKQFQSFVGTRTMLQETYSRTLFLGSQNIFVATNAEYVHLVKKQLPKLSRSQLLIEPALRDTGPSICHGAARLAEKGFANEIMAVIYADHLIQKEKTFREALLSAEKYIRATHKIGVIGVKALSPNPNLGYIKIEKLIEHGPSHSIHELERFVEKPHVREALTYVNSYHYLWNTGLYTGLVANFLAAFKKYSPAIFRAIAQHAYEEAPKISIDYAIIEKLPPKQMFVIPADLGWNDIGTWSALFEQLVRGSGGNVVSGLHKGINTQGCLIMSRGKKLIATSGLKNFIVVDTPDALLILPRSQASEVKTIVEMLKKEGRAKFL